MDGVEAFIEPVGIVGLTELWGGWRMLRVTCNFHDNVDTNGFEDVERVGAMFYVSPSLSTTTIVAKLPAI